MSAEVDRIKKLVSNDLLVEAVELPAGHRKAFVADDLEEVLSRFDDDGDYAHFVIRVKRSSQPLPKAPTSPQIAPQVSIDAMVTETLEMLEQTQEMKEGPTATPVQSDSPDYDSSFLLENAKILEENGDYPLARNIYQALIRKGLTIPQGLAGMARTYEKEGQNEKAIRCYQEAIAYSSELVFFQGLAAIQIRLGKDEDAAQTIIHALGLVELNDEQKFELHKSLGNCYTRLGDYAKAEHHYRRAYELNSKSDILQVNVGSLALQKNDLDAAQKHFQKALELNPSNDKAISGLGMVYMAKSNTSKAYECFLESLRINLGNLGAIYNLVKCAYELKLFGDAALILRKYIDSNPVNTNILYSYAGILFHKGEYVLAAAEVKKILESNPNHAGAKELGELINSKEKENGIKS